MAIYTDMADELYQKSKGQIPSGVKMQTSQIRDMTIHRVQITNSGLERPAGNYITVQLPNLATLDEKQQTYIDTIGQELERLLPQTGPVLVVGVGNRRITADALGPRVAGNVLVTRGLAQSEVTAQLGLREVASISPGASGITGIPLVQLLAGMVRTLKPSAILCVDSLCTAQPQRLGSTVQISDTGLHPAQPKSGRCITRAMLGVPVLALGIPTMMETQPQPQACPLIVVPKELDRMVRKGSALLGLAVNRALQPKLTVEELRYLAN